MSGTFSVKNFAKFQHYKDRSPPWIRLYNSLLDDYEFGRLQDASKMHLLAIWLLASRYENRIPFDPDWIGRRINATEVVNLDVLVSSGFIVPDEDCSMMLAERQHVASKVLIQSREEKSREETEQRRTNPARARAKNDPEFEETFWPAYPNKVGKPKASVSFAAARKAYSLDVIMAGLERYKQAKPPDRQWMNPATFLNQERFNDQPAAVKPSGKPDPTAYTPKPAPPAEDSLDALLVEGFEGLHGEELAEFKREMKATQKRAN